MAAKRMLPLIALVLIATGAIAILGETVPDAPALGPSWALVSMSLGALALLAGLRAAGAPLRGLPERILLGWSLLLPVSPMAALYVLPVAAVLMVPKLAADGGWRPVARTVEWLTLVTGFGVLALTYVVFPGEQVMIGLVERGLLGAELALLGVLAGRAAMVAWARSGLTRVLTVS
ncbi:DUF998 domain-containing protein [Nonomuraea sp. NPDC050663]|uniref:DUF998 domain-containing protein n=1 Tax=Nonomuraea sp. NPDC050663 TaxID=3364370 RepID=UPI0037934C0B